MLWIESRKSTVKSTKMAKRKGMTTWFTLRLIGPKSGNSQAKWYDWNATPTTVGEAGR